jgi:hypothetical protein
MPLSVSEKKSIGALLRVSSCTIGIQVYTNFKSVLKSMLWKRDAVRTAMRKKTCKHEEAKATQARDPTPKYTPKSVFSVVL